MGYTKITQGWVEQVYDDEGNCIEQEFVPTDDVDRRDALDESIEDVEWLAEIESKEKHCPFYMIQPENKWSEIKQYRWAWRGEFSR